MASSVQIGPEVLVPLEAVTSYTYTVGAGLDVGSEPKAVLIVGNRSQGPHGAFSVGFAVPGQGVSGEYCVSVGMKSGVAASNTFKSAVESCAGMLGDPSVLDATDSSTDGTVTYMNGTFTGTKTGIAWYRNNYTNPGLGNEAPENALVIPFHGDGVQAKSGKGTCPASGTATITGLGFRPDLIWFISADKDFEAYQGPFMPPSTYFSNEAFVSYGFCDIQGSTGSPTFENRLMSFTETDNVDPTTAGSYHSDDYCCVRSVHTGTGAITQPFSVTGQSDDGFTITVGPAGASTYEFAYMAINVNGAQRTTNNTNDGILVPSGTTAQQDLSDLDPAFNPQGVIALLGQMTPYDAGRTNNQAATFGLGAGQKQIYSPGTDDPWGNNPAEQTHKQFSLTVQTDDAASSASLTYNTRSDTAMFHVPKGVFSSGVPLAGVSGEWIFEFPGNYDTVDFSVAWSSVIANRIYPFIAFGEGLGISLTVDTLALTAAVTGFTGATMFGGANQIIPQASVALTISDEAFEYGIEMTNSLIAVAAAAQSTTVGLVYEEGVAEPIEMRINVTPHGVDWDQTAYIDATGSDTTLNATAIPITWEGGVYQQTISLPNLLDEPGRHLSIRISDPNNNPTVVQTFTRTASTLSATLAVQPFTVANQGQTVYPDTLALQAELGSVDVEALVLQSITISNINDYAITVSTVSGLTVVAPAYYYLDLSTLQVRAKISAVATTGGTTTPIKGAAFALAPRAASVSASVPSAIAQALTPRAEKISATATNG